MTRAAKLNLYDLEFEDLEALLVAWGCAPLHARRVWRWLYREGEPPLAEIAALPRVLRERLATETQRPLPVLLDSRTSPDGSSRKDLLQLDDGEEIEVVLMRYRQRYSACISTQVGCACGCSFCATGQMGFVRDLTAGEIVTQVVHMRHALAAQQKTLSNVVLMGMGEPLLNYDNTLAAIRRLCDVRGMGFVARRITLSTAGIAPAICQLADDAPQIGLALSLHAASDELRTRLMPINARYPLAVLFAALGDYTARTGRRVFMEWVMIDGVNDTQEQLDALISLVGDLPAHVNLIRLNPTRAYGQSPATEEALERFAAALDRHGVPHTVRQRRGLDIAAGCGQLRAQHTRGSEVVDQGDKDD